MDNKEITVIKFNDKMPVAYVIGGAGFIGSYVCESLRAQNVNVIAIDDLSSGKQANLEKTKGDPGLVFVQADINAQLDDKLPSPDYIFHIGGIEAYVNGVDLTLNTMLVNSIGTYNTLELAKKSKAKYLLVSSLDIYNGALSSLNLNKYFGLSERDTKRYTHHEAKRYAEALVIEYFKKYDIDARIVRIAETYGPRMDLSAGTELAQLVKDAINTDSLTINGDGLKVLHPTFVADITTGITKAMFSSNTAGKIYNLACQSEINLLNLAYIIQKNSTKPLKIQFTQEYKEIKFPMHKVELEQSQNDLGWQAKTKLEEGITQTLEYFFLNREKLERETSKRVQQIEEKSNVIPYIPPSPPKTIENPASPPSMPPARQENKVEKTTKKTGKVNKANLAILGTSLFIILLMFIFPISALYATSSWALTGALEAANIQNKDISQRNKDIADAQKNLQLADSQFDNLEWFFSMISKRAEFESSRTALQVVDKFTRALAAKLNVDTENSQIIIQSVNGKVDQNIIESNTRKYNDVVLLLENSVLESQGVNKTIFTQKENNQVSSLQKLAASSLEAERTNIIQIQNIRKIISPTSKRHYAIIFVDNNFYNSRGGNIYGFALVKAESTGIQDFKTFEMTKLNSSYLELINQIKIAAEGERYGNIEALVLVNNKTRDSLLNALKTVNVEKYAEVITPQNINEKANKVDATSEYKIAVWEAIWNGMKQAKDWQSLGQALTKSIKDEDAQILMIQNGSITTPVCGEENVLRNTISIGSDDEAIKAYCIIPRLTSDSPLGTALWDIHTSVKTTATQQLLTLKNDIKNTDPEPKKISLSVTTPGTAKLNNVLAPFPVSFDNIKTANADNQTTWTYEFELQAERSIEVTFEWQANLSDGNIADQGIYIEKQFGTQNLSISAEIQPESGKTVKSSAKDQDLYLSPQK